MDHPEWTSNISCLTPLRVAEPAVLNVSANVFQDKCVQQCATRPDRKLTAQVFTDCLSYANISHYLTPTLSSNTDNAVILASDFSDTTSSPGPEGYGRSLVQCMPQFCNLSPGCNSRALTNCTIEALLPGPNALSLEAVANCRKAICPTTSMNSDIAGVGACISYTVQFALTMTFALVSGSLWGWQWWQKRSVERLKTSTQMCDNVRGRKLRQKMRTLDHVDSLFDLVVDIATTFHKGVCWFAFAFSVATARLIQPGITRLNDLDQQALIIIAGCQIFTVSTMLCLKTVIRPRSVTWFDFVLSFVSWLLTLGVSPSVILAIGDLNELARTPGETCGDLKVLDFCNRAIIHKPGLTIKNYFITVPFIAMALVVRSVRQWKDLDIQRQDKVKDWMRSSYVGFTSIGAPLAICFPARMTTEKHVPRNGSRTSGIIPYRLQLLCYKFCKGTIVFGMGISLLTMVIVTGWWVVSTSTSGFTKQISQEWSFGQIVSVIIWAPVAVDFVEKTIQWRRDRNKRRKDQELWKNWSPSLSSWSVHKCDHCSPGSGCGPGGSKSASLLNGLDSFPDMTPAPTYTSRAPDSYKGPSSSSSSSLSPSSYKTLPTRFVVGVSELFTSTSSSTPTTHQRPARTDYFSIPSPAPLYTPDGNARHS